MPHNESLGTGLGTLGGAGLGALLALPTGGLSVLAGAGLGGLFGGTGGGILGGLFGKKHKANLPDISGELARISALFEKARKASIENIKQQAGQTRKQSASNLASRGILRSRVSEHTFGEIDRAKLAAIGQAEGHLAGQEAGISARLLQSLMGQSFAADQLEQQRRQQGQAGLFGALGGILPLLMQAGAGGRAGVGAPGPTLPAATLPGSSGLLFDRTPSMGTNDFLLRALRGG